MRIRLSTSLMPRARTMSLCAAARSTCSCSRDQDKVLDLQPSFPTASANGARAAETGSFGNADHLRGGGSWRKSSYSRWTDVESQKLVSLVRNTLRERASPHWKEIAAHFPRRSKPGVVLKFYALQPGVRAHVKMKWSERDLQLAMVHLSQGAPYQGLIAKLPAHSVLSIQRVLSILRKPPDQMGSPMERREQPRRNPYFDPLPRRHRRRWSIDDIGLLKRLRPLSLQADWAYISNVLGRTPDACRRMFYSFSRPQDISQFPVPDIGECTSNAGKHLRWSDGEIQKLVACVTEIEDPPSWPKLLESLPGRSAVACVHKWQKIRKSLAGSSDGRPRRPVPSETPQRTPERTPHTPPPETS